MSLENQPPAGAGSNATLKLKSTGVVEFEIDGTLERLGITEDLGLVTPLPEDVLPPVVDTPGITYLGRTTYPQSSRGKWKGKGRRSKNGKYRPAECNPQQSPVPCVPLSDSPPSAVVFPEPTFRIVEFQEQFEEYKLSDAYLRYVESTPEEHKDDIVYDLDEQDIQWLGLINKENEMEGVKRVHMEFIMDQLEKESYFQMQRMGMALCQGVDDDDAVCCICLNGDCYSKNAIIFCDMCNLAVHQDCYGVPYILEGQWFCRKCLHSPNQPLECVFCPNKDGALKATEDGRWAHIACALWIPEVGFANSVFLEPIEYLDRIPARKWKLTCFVCKEKGVGVCIQCEHPNCNKGFHVTCAQEAKLILKVGTSRRMPMTTLSAKSKGSAYCKREHVPSGMIQTKKSSTRRRNDDTVAKIMIERARKVLAKRRDAVPTGPNPAIPKERLSIIVNTIDFPGKCPFLKLVVPYWKLKRHFRNGVPLIPRLQLASPAPIPKSTEPKPQQPQEVAKSTYSLIRLRQDLERARLLCEMIRKREKLKRGLILAKLKVTALRICPKKEFFESIIREIKSHDHREIFFYPVDLDDVPDYLEKVNEPMDLGTMSTKVEQMEYETVEEVERDFNLMITNCLHYNRPSTIYHKVAIRLNDDGKLIFEKAKNLFRSIGYDPITGIHTIHSPPVPVLCPRVSIKMERL